MDVNPAHGVVECSVIHEHMCPLSTHTHMQPHQLCNLNYGARVSTFIRIAHNIQGTSRYDALYFVY